jgi:hypothetical protein
MFMPERKMTTNSQSESLLLRRLGGLALVVLGLGPVIAVVCGIAIVVALCAGTVRATAQKVAGIAAIVSNEIVPQVKKVEASYAAVAAQVEQTKAEIGKAIDAVTQIEDISIKPGQLGSTGSVHIHIPDHEVSVGPVKFNDGELFNQSLPEVQIPPAPVALPLAPLRAAFAPLGPDGPLGKAIGASQKELEATFGEVTKLEGPLQEVETKVLDGLAPLEDILARIALIGLATLAALGILLAIYVATGVLLVIYRRPESARAYRTGGVIGFVLFIYQTLLMTGVSRLLGRTPTPSPEQAIAELQQMVARLETELAALRAELSHRRAALPN